MPHLELAGEEGGAFCLKDMSQVLLPEERGPDLEQAKLSWSAALTVNVEGDEVCKLPGKKKINKLPGTLWECFSSSEFFSVPLSVFNHLIRRWNPL